MNAASSIVIDLPDWIWEECEAVGPLASVEERMRFVIGLAERNVADGGGPFGAAIFDAEGNVLAPGVNLVVPASAPVAHAEIVAIAMAGQRLGTWDIGSAGGFELVSTTEPCAMCLGAVPWSGVKQLVCGARDADARAVGFDEGHKPADWVERLTADGIVVLQDVEREGAADVLRNYATAGGSIYNGSDRTSPDQNNGEA